MKKLLFLSICTMLLFGCEKPEHNGCLYCDAPPYVQSVFSRSYVLGYFNPTGIKLAMGYDRLFSNYSPNLYITKGEFTGTYLDEGEKKETYDALCEKNGDMTFNCEHTLVGSSPENPGIIAYPNVNIVSIDAVSNADFDEEHPAGTSLSDVIFFSPWWSAKKFIENGYVDDTDIDINDPVIYGMTYKSLNSFTGNELALIGSGDIRWKDTALLIGSLITYKNPSMSKTHAITVTVTFEDGRVLTDMITMNFE